jgi:hypothetical protein
MSACGPDSAILRSIAATTSLSIGHQVQQIGRQRIQQAAQEFRAIVDHSNAFAKRSGVRCRNRIDGGCESVAHG